MGAAAAFFLGRKPPDPTDTRKVVYVDASYMDKRKIDQFIKDKDPALFEELITSYLKDKDPALFEELYGDDYEP